MLLPLPFLSVEQHDYGKDKKSWQKESQDTQNLSD